MLGREERVSRLSRRKFGHWRMEVDLSSAASGSVTAPSAGPWWGVPVWFSVPHSLSRSWLAPSTSSPVQTRSDEARPTLTLNVWSHQQICFFPILSKDEHTEHWIETPPFLTTSERQTEPRRWTRGKNLTFCLSHIQLPAMAPTLCKDKGDAAPKPKRAQHPNKLPRVGKGMLPTPPRVPATSI